MGWGFHCDGAESHCTRREGENKTRFTLAPPLRRSVSFASSFSSRDEWRKISSITVKKWVELKRGRERDKFRSRSGAGKGQEEKRKKAGRKGGMSRGYTNTGQTESQLAHRRRCHFPPAVTVTRATHQLDPDLVLLTSSSQKPFPNQGWSCIIILPF